MLLGLCVFGCAATLLYDRRPYTEADLERWRSSGAGLPVHYATGEGHQVAFYLPPPGNPAQPPERLWLLFCGVHHQALGWLPWLEPRPDAGAGLLLLDYPGYGLCQGIPSAAAIQESALASLEALGRRLGCPTTDLASRLHILGHSMGTGPAVNLAQAVRPQRLVLISPWTSFREVGRHRYGTVSGAIAYTVVGEEYDNRAGLRQLGQAANPPPLTVVHGAEDTVIPAWMGRELAGAYAGPAEYRELPGRGHDGIVATVLPALLAVP